jgi:predicted metal-dependent hydrolase
VTPNAAAAEGQVVWLHYDGEPPLPVQCRRHVRARRLSLRLTVDGARLTLPRRVSETAALRFLDEHRDWLREQRRRSGLAALPDAFAAGTAGELPLWGQPRPLRWREARCCRLLHEGDGLLFERPQSADARRVAAVLRGFLEAEARARLGLRLPALLPGLPRAPRRFRFAPLSSLWGSLSPRDHVSLDLALVLAPPAMFDYVLVHELCHLIQPNHSPAFWAEVAARCPEWTAARRWLRGEGMGLKAQLQALLRAG